MDALSNFGGNVTDQLVAALDQTVFAARYAKYWWAIAFGMLGGGLASIAGLIVSKKPDLADKLESINEYFGYIGAFMLFAGVWGLVDGLVISKFYTQLPLGKMPVMGLAVFLYPPVCLALGLLQGLPLIGQWTGKDMSKIEEQAKKLIIVQVPIGFVAIGCGIIWLLMLIGLGPF